MKTTPRQPQDAFSARPPRGNNQAGNAVIYVLLVIALFAALTFILAKHSDTSETSTISKSQIEIASTQILQVSMQAKQAVDGMMYSGSRIDTLDFTLPSDPGYDTPPNGQKVFHPGGGGVILPRLPDHATVAGSDPAPGWYMGSFNNVAWTPTTDNDVIMTAHHLAKDVCAKIDEQLTGSSTIPVATVALNRVLIDGSRHTGGTIDFSSSACPGCVGHAAMCVEESSHDSWSFYSLVETR